MGEGRGREGGGGSDSRQEPLVLSLDYFLEY